MAYSDSLRQTYATFTTAADLIDGVISASTVFSAFNLSSTSTAIAYIYQYSGDAAGGWLAFRKSRGTSIPTNTIVASGDVLGQIVFSGANGTSYTDGARIRAIVSATPGASNDMPTDLVFETVPDGSGTLAERMRITQAGNVGIGRASPGSLGNLEVGGSTYAATCVASSSASGSILILAANSTSETRINTNSNHPMLFYTNNTERFRIAAAGDMQIGTSNADPVANNVAGTVITTTGNMNITKDSAAALYINRRTNDGDLVQFYQAGTLEGSISVAGTTITYGAFCGAHWTQLSDGTKPTIEIGTVMESINELCEWSGEVNERLPRVKISDTVSSKKVYGVFSNWDEDWTDTNDMNIASLGVFFCRVAAGTVLEIGDLLDSAGNGFGKKQADDLVRSSTIGKVVGVTPCHYAQDGSFCIQTVLMCG
jgi:hypothetical protein